MHSTCTGTSRFEIREADAQDYCVYSVQQNCTHARQAGGAAVSGNSCSAERAQLAVARGERNSYVRQQERLDEDETRSGENEREGEGEL